MQLFYCPGIKQGDVFLDAVESHHCVKVLRKKTGELINITDGLGNFYTAELTDLNPKKCSFKILSTRVVKRPRYSIHIAIAPTKNSDRMEWFVEKAVEIGVDKVSFIQTAYSERKTINLERMEKKAFSAMKQAARAFVPELTKIEKLDNLLRSEAGGQKFIAHLEDASTEYLEALANPENSYLILIGPEGGFSDEEIAMAKEKQFIIAKLGDYRLRTETAGIVACSILNHIN